MKPQNPFSLPKHITPCLFLALLLLQGIVWAAGSDDYHAPAFSVLPTSVMQSLNDGRDIVLADIRPVEDFQRLRIPGSINIPLYRINTALFLKQQPVVLVHSGYGCRALEKEAASLKAEGASIRILEGGLPAWVRRGGKVEGDPFAKEKLNRIPCHAFLLEKGAPDLSVVYLGISPPERLLALFPQTVQVPASGLGPALDNLINAGPQFHRAVIIGQSGREYDALETGIPTGFKERIFFLEGGMDELQRVLNRQRLATRPVNERKISAGPCTACGDKNRQTGK